MKISSKCAFAALAIVGVASAVSAQSVYFTKATINGGNFNGGEFVAHISTGQTYRSFCLEIGEFISLGSNNTYDFEIVSGNVGAADGGNGGGVGNPPRDPISNATAAVFMNWMNLPAASLTQAMNRDVQRAIWWLEEENPGTLFSGLTGTVQAIINNALVGLGYTDANDAQGEADFNQALFPKVRVLNPFEWEDTDGDGVLDRVEAQSQIILIPLPTASGMALAGLALVGGIRRRK